ncbi:MAG: glutamyl-tRNA reductase [Myxococcota bacterium]
MSDLLVVGLSHHTASLELREKLAVDDQELAALLKEATSEVVGEAVVISTCNRVELYGASDDPAAAAARARRFLSGKAGKKLDEELYTHRGRDAVRHAFRVASSLDSMVVGEPQILGQVKQAFESASSVGVVGPLLGRCFQRALAVAKRVRTETGIAEGTVSVSSIASELARKIFGDLQGRRVVLLGAGEMGEAAAKALAGSGARLRVVNRSAKRAEKVVAVCGGEAVRIEQLAAELVAADVVITSTASPNYVLTVDLMRDVVRARRHRPLFLIDIAVPRDVDPRVGELATVFCYDVDDLQRVAEENLSIRRKEAAAAERIVSVEVAEFEAWRRSLDLTPTIVALRAHFQEVVRRELERTRPRLGEMTSAQEKALDRMTQAMVNKLLHRPLMALKKGDPGEAAELIATARRLFELDEEAPEAPETRVVERRLATKKS